MNGHRIARWVARCFSDQGSAVGQQTTAELVIGSEFAGYRIDEVAARGGMGVVYRATQLRLTRTVALKLVTPALARDPSFRERFRREWMIAASIDHPNVIPVYEAGEEDGVLFIAMRWVEGTNLRDDDRSRPARARACRPPRLPGRERSRRRPRAGPHPSRRQAGEHPGHRPGPRLPDRLRPHEARQLDQRPDEDGPVDGHGGLHGAGADRRGVRDVADGRVLAWMRPVRGIDRPAPVPAGERPGDALGSCVYAAAVGARGHAGRTRARSTTSFSAPWPRIPRSATRPQASSAARRWPRRTERMLPAPAEASAPQPLRSLNRSHAPGEPRQPWRPGRAICRRVAAGSARDCAVVAIVSLVDRTRRHQRRPRPPRRSPPLPRPTRPTGAPLPPCRPRARTWAARCWTGRSGWSAGSGAAPSARGASRATTR